MASNLVLTGSPSGSLTLYGTADAALAANGIVYFGLSSGRASPWEIIGYPGADAIRAKFMGAKPRTYQISGAVLNLATESLVRTAMASVMALNKAQTSYTLASGSLILHDGNGVVVEDIASQLVGGGDGVWWRFTINMRDLGTT